MCDNKKSFGLSLGFKSFLTPNSMPRDLGSTVTGNMLATPTPTRRGCQGHRGHQTPSSDEFHTPAAGVSPASFGPAGWGRDAGQRCAAALAKARDLHSPAPTQTTACWESALFSTPGSGPTTTDWSSGSRSASPALPVTATYSHKATLQPPSILKGSSSRFRALTASSTGVSARVTSAQREPGARPLFRGAAREPLVEVRTSDGARQPSSPPELFGPPPVAPPLGINVQSPGGRQTILNSPPEPDPSGLTLRQWTTQAAKAASELSPAQSPSPAAEPQTPQWPDASSCTVTFDGSAAAFFGGRGEEEKEPVGVARRPADKGCTDSRRVRFTTDAGEGPESAEVQLFSVAGLGVNRVPDSRTLEPALDGHAANCTGLLGEVGALGLFCGAIAEAFSACHVAGARQKGSRQKDSLAPAPISGDRPRRNLGSAKPLSSMEKEFPHNEGLLRRLVELQDSGYKGWRRVRGDGNCFYRAVGFSLLEQAASSDDDLHKRWVQDFYCRLAGLRFEDAAERRGHQSLLALVRDIQQSPPGGRVDVLEVLSDPQRPEDLAMIRAIKVLAARHLLENAHKELNGLSYETAAIGTGFEGGVVDFCEKVVLPMSEAAEFLALNATPEALGMDLRIAVLDRRDSLCFEDYLLVRQEGQSCPLVHVLLKPGHYDILYPNGAF